MLVRHKSLSMLFACVFACSATLTYGQVFTDDDFLAADYTTSGIGTIQDIVFNVDYSAIDVFGDGFLTANIPEAPNSSGGAATTGVFITVNNDSIALGGSGVESFASISPTLANVNVGLGTATEDYVMQVDVWHSTGTGTDDGAGNLDFTGTTNYSLVGINQSNTTVRIQENNSAATAGQGVTLAITADGGAAEDYLPHYGGAGYRLREGIGANVAGDGTNFRSGQGDNPDLVTGLAGDAINQAWIDTGLGYAYQTAANPAVDDDLELNQFTGNAAFFAPNPANPDGFFANGSGSDRTYFVDEGLVNHDDPQVVTAALTPPAFQLGNGFNGGGQPYNRWATHRVYYIDETVTYTIEYTDENGVASGEEIVVLEKLINDPTDVGADTVFDDTSDSGSVVLGFWDRFGGSIALSPEGANFVVYDNLSVSAANPGDAPTLASTIAAFIPGQEGDYDFDGDVDSDDYFAWLRSDGTAADPDATGKSGLGFAAWRDNYGTGVLAATAAVPEPTSLVLLLGLSAGLLARRRA